MTNEKNEKKEAGDTAIAYQNKDIACKIFGENLKEITKEESKQIKEWIMMTKIGQLFEEEKQEAVKKAVKEAVTKTTKESIRISNIKFARKLLLKGMSVEEILDITEILTREDIEELAQEIPADV